MIRPFMQGFHNGARILQEYGRYGRIDPARETQDDFLTSDVG